MAAIIPRFSCRRSCLEFCQDFGETDNRKKIVSLQYHGRFREHIHPVSPHHEEIDAFGCQGEELGDRFTGQPPIADPGLGNDQTAGGRHFDLRPEHQFCQIKTENRAKDTERIGDGIADSRILAARGFHRRLERGGAGQ